VTASGGNVRPIRRHKSFVLANAVETGSQHQIKNYGVGNSQISKSKGAKP
jgi:hypothetical protein